MDYRHILAPSGIAGMNIDLAHQNFLTARSDRLSYVRVRKKIVKTQNGCHQSVRGCVRGQISETIHSIIFIFGMLFRYHVPGVMLVFFKLKKSIWLTYAAVCAEIGHLF